MAPPNPDTNARAFLVQMAANLELISPDEMRQGLDRCERGDGQPVAWAMEQEVLSDAIVRAMFGEGFLEYALAEELVTQAEAQRLLSMRPEPTTTESPVSLAQIGGYQIERHLGDGGMGRVYLAERDGLHALKVLRSDFARRPEYLQRFEREAELTQRLDHPNIVKVRRAGVERGLAYLVMEYHPGGTLADVVSDELPLPPSDALQMVSEIADALVYSHGQGMLHRDLKPENILIGEDGGLKLADFGLVKEIGLAQMNPRYKISADQLIGIEREFREQMIVLIEKTEGEVLLQDWLRGLTDRIRGLHSETESTPDDWLGELDPETRVAALRGAEPTKSAGLTRTGECLGTPLYMSPEQLAGYHTDGRTDIFSLGVIYYYLVTGKMPWPGETLHEIVVGRLSSDAEDPTLHRSRLPEAHARVLMKMLARSPDRRYPTAKFLRQDLRRLERGLQPLLDTPRWWEEVVLADVMEYTNASLDNEEAYDILAGLLDQFLQMVQCAEDRRGDSMSITSGITIEGLDDESLAAAPLHFPSSQRLAAVRRRSGRAASRSAVTRRTAIASLVVVVAAITMMLWSQRADRPSTEEGAPPRPQRPRSEVVDPLPSMELRRVLATREFDEALALVEEAPAATRRALMDSALGSFSARGLLSLYTDARVIAEWIRNEIRERASQQYRRQLITAAERALRDGQVGTAQGLMELVDTNVVWHQDWVATVLDDMSEGDINRLRSLKRTRSWRALSDALTDHGRSWIDQAQGALGRHDVVSAQRIITSAGGDPKERWTLALAGLPVGTIAELLELAAGHQRLDEVVSWMGLMVITKDHEVALRMTKECLLKANGAKHDARHNDARRNLNIYLAFKPRDALWLAYRARLRAAVGRFSAAEADIGASNQAQPDNVPAQLALALLRFSQGRPRDAVSQLDKCLPSGSGGGPNQLKGLAYLYRGLIRLLSLEQPTESIGDFTEAQKQLAGHFDFAAGVGRSLAELARSSNQQNLNQLSTVLGKGTGQRLAHLEVRELMLTLCKAVQKHLPGHPMAWAEEAGVELSHGMLREGLAAARQAADLAAKSDLYKDQREPIDVLLTAIAKSRCTGFVTSLPLPDWKSWVVAPAGEWAASSRELIGTSDLRSATWIRTTREFAQLELSFELSQLKGHLDVLLRWENVSTRHLLTLGSHEYRAPGWHLVRMTAKDAQLVVEIKHPDMPGNTKVRTVYRISTAREGPIGFRLGPGSSCRMRFIQIKANALSTQDSRKQLVRRAGLLIAARQLGDAERTLIQAGGTSQISDELWDESLAKVSPQTMVKVLEHACKERRWDRLCRRLGHLLTLHDPRTAERLGRDVLKQAVGLTKSNRYAPAVPVWTKYLAFEPTDHRAYRSRGECYRCTLQDDLALADYAKALELKPDDQGTLNNRAIIRRARGKYTEALRDHARSMRGVTDGSRTMISLLINRGLTYLVAGQPAKAEADYRAVMRIQDGAYVRVMLALAMAGQGRKNEARQELAAHLEKKPGKLLGRLGPLRSHVKLAGRMIALLPDHPLPRAERAAVHLVLREPVKAVADLEAALNLTDRSAHHQALRPGILTLLQKARKQLRD